MKKVYFLFLIFMFSIFGCREVTMDVDGIEIPNNAFYYQAYDASGILIVHGWFELNENSEGIYEGKWELKALNSGYSTGPQIGKGNLRGSKIGNEIQIEMNPDMMDNNVLLSGKMEGNVLSGTWNYYGFVGLMASGKFRAEKNIN